MESNDWIRETVAARAAERGLTAYAVAELCPPANAARSTCCCGSRDGWCQSARIPERAAPNVLTHPPADTTMVTD